MSAALKRATVGLALLALPAALSAQLPASVSARAIALGGAYTSIARGWEAALTNPALLGSVGRQRLTIGLPNTSFETGSNTYTFSDFRKYANRTLTDADKAYLLNRIRQDDSALTLRTIVGVAPVGLSIGPFAVAAYTSGDFDFSMGADAFELALYGNAHRSSPGDFFNVRGTRGNGWAATTLAASYGMSIGNTPLGRTSVGVTYKKILGHAMGRAAELNSRFQVNPTFQAVIAGHSVYTDIDTDSTCSIAFSLSASSDPCSMNAGAGYGVDVGAVFQMNGRRLTLSVVLVNALGSMTWDPSRLVYERTYDTLTETSSGGNNTIVNSRVSTHLSQAGINADPTARAFRDSLLAHADFSQVLRFGAATRRGMMTLTAGGSLRLREGLDRQPAQTVAAGAELRLLRVLPIRAGIQSDLGSTLVLSAGSGINLFGFNFDASIASISGNERPGVIVGMGIGFIW